MRNRYPILEFDDDRAALLRPQQLMGEEAEGAEVAEHCVLCFFAEAIEKILAEFPHRVVAGFRAESLRLPLYELDFRGGKVGLIQAAVGAPLAASQIEELTALGCRKFIACGSCGVLQEDLLVGDLILPALAVRDEGTSYHYLPPSREVKANAHVLAVIEEILQELGLPYRKGKTWTTDAIYRETPAKIRQRRLEGCIAVEMEAAAYMAVAQYLEVEFGQILYAGDSLSGAAWEMRSFNTRHDIREAMLRLALDICQNL